MKTDEGIFVVKSKESDALFLNIKDFTNVHLISIDELFLKDERFDDSIVFINKEIKPDDVKKIVLINPGVNLILFFNKELKYNDIVCYVKSGITDTVHLNDKKNIKLLIDKYSKGSYSSNINYYNNLFKKFSEIGIITNNIKMAEIYSMVEKVSMSNSTVLIYGESGTGKELIAKSIHYFSNRKNYNFVAVNTGAIPENLLEDELFGHVKGSFTSAVKDRKGKFEYAHRGTIFLDEISNMPQSLQVKLLRILQEREFERIGDNQTIRVDVRVISATNKDLKELVDKGDFREDLYYRLNVIPIFMPPLRERKSDIPLLANYFVKKYCILNNLKLKSFNMSALRILKEYDWPGNVRQLENIVERMVVLNPDVNVFMPSHIPKEIKSNVREEVKDNKVLDEIPDEGISLNSIIKSIERDLILKSLEKTDWNKQKAANLLGIKRTTLIEKLKKLNKEVKK